MFVLKKKNNNNKINFDGFSSAKLYQQQLLRLYVVMKNIYNFAKKSELSKLILPMKISPFIINIIFFFLRFPRWK